MSGGQKQRIGIARALYTNPDLLILDEATNALDEVNEKQIIKEIFNISEKMTILIVAHRISSLAKCVKIIFLEDGVLKDFGNYDDIVKKYKLI